MKLALIFGLNQGNVVKSRLQDRKDNLIIDCFEDVPNFIDIAIKRNSIYDRILVLSTKVNESLLTDLHSYWGSTSSETQVVLLCKTNQDELKAKMFMDIFLTPVASAMLVPTTTVEILKEAVLRPTTELTRDYGIKDFLDVEIDEDVYVPEEPDNIDTEQSSSSASQTSQTAVTSQVKSSKPKKSLFGGIFGKLSGVLQPNSNDTPNENQQQSTDSDNASYNENSNNVNSAINIESDNIECDNYSSNQNIDSDFDSSSVSDEFSISDDISHEADDFASDSEPVIDLDNDLCNSDDDFNTSTEDEDASPIENTDISQTNSSPVDTNSFENDFEEVPLEENDFEPELIEDINFGNDTFNESSSDNTTQNASVGSINENFGDTNIGAEEDSYRQQVETPKVVTQTVVREVVRNVRGKLQTLEGVYSGRLRKVVIVTGDRGTGVTCTALAIAKELAKKVDVLYFDCDTKNHGVLNYIDYDSFKNYEQTHMNGTKLCKSSQAFDRCVCAFDDNFYLLTSDFSCDTNDDELKATSEIVAERANDFGVVVVDCPVDKLHLITDLVLVGESVICTEGSKRGFMNMLCQFESSTLPMRFKRTLVSKGLMLVTKCPKNLDLSRLLKYISLIYEPDSVNWLDTQPREFNGKLTDSLLNDILEG